MTLAALLVFAAALFATAGSPGPSIAALVARVFSTGLKSVLPFLAAMWVGAFLWLAAAVGGLIVLAQTYAPVFSVLKYVGCLYLLYLAWRMWTAPTDVRAGELPAGSALQMFMTGMAITLGNPKIMVFYLALLPALIDLDHLTIAGFAALAATALAVLVIVDLAWAFAAAGARQFFRTPRAMRIANRTGAAAMGGAALVIATK